MIRRQRRWDAISEDDPGAGLLNLFDVWIAFSVALLLALVTYLNKGDLPALAQGKDSLPSAESVKQLREIPHYRPTDTPMTGQGVRLGTAYQLKSGEVVYVPDATE